jgi:hypothetical protein
LLEPNASWDDPLYDGAKGDNVKLTAIPRLAAWAQGRRIEKFVKHLRTIADPKRVVIEDVLRLKDGLIWNQEKQRSEKAADFELAVTVVADRSLTSPGAYT